MSRLLNHLNFPNICVEGCSYNDLKERAYANQLFTPGSYAIAWEEGDDIFLARDPIGVNKLFYGFDNNGNIIVANRIRKLTECGIHIDKVSSCPAGHLVKISKENIVEVTGTAISDRPVFDDFNLEVFQRTVREKLGLYFEYISERWPEAIFVVCLSGGLDSSIIAHIAKNKLTRVYAASFSFADDESILNPHDIELLKAKGSLSDDFYAAAEIANTLDLPLIPILRKKSALSSAVALATHLAQDWRDFNVHCAVVNLFLAQDIRARFPDSEVIVLTGDLMNEYVCDYHEEEIDGAIYYPQPRIDILKRRRFFMRGLDSGDREVGVFNAFGLTVCQPYSAVSGDYVSVPGTYLESPDSKMILNSHLLPDKLLDKVGKAKVRAQVGGKDGGVLGAFHNLGLGEKKLFEIWKSGFPVDAVPDDPSDIIQFGRYRTMPKGES
ncbi:MAG: asparagine synthase-related protein [Candidatus Pacearchaeota archaeon]|nr:asparagine synthase-related protein [Candidatus Pacearchaeota archaeon]